jgi:DNA polymerase I
VNITHLTTRNQVVDTCIVLNCEGKPVVLDLETTGLSPHKDKILDCALMQLGSDDVYFVPQEHIANLQYLRTPLIGQNFKFDLHMLYRAGVDLRQHWYADTMLLDHLLDENQEHGLDAIIQRRYKDNYKEKFWSKYDKYEAAPREAQIEYNAKDVNYTGLVYRDTLNDLTAAGVPQSLILHVHKLARVLLDTEINGLKLDVEYLRKIAEELSTKIRNFKYTMREGIENQIEQMELDAWMVEIDKRLTPKGKSGVKRPIFNWDSGAQLQGLIYGKLKLPVQYNKKRKPTLDDAALEAIETKHPLIPQLRAYRGDQKVYTAFIEASFEKMVGGRIYPSFNVNGTVTGRLSASNPNLQQLPREGGIRGIYIPEPGYKFVSIDFSQLEIVIAAHFSRDPMLLSIVLEGKNQHDITAAALKIDRSLAKVINFGILYGAGVSKVQAVLGCSKEQAEKQLEVYWATYKGLHDWVKSCHDKVERGEYLENPFGRRRHFPTTFADKWELERAKRQAANSVIQSTGADITHEASYLVNDKLKELGLGYLVLSAHDELLIAAKENACEEATAVAKSIMEGVGKRIGLTVPLIAEAGKPQERWTK